MTINKETEMAGPAPPAPGLPKKRDSSDEVLNVYDDAKTYYTAEDRHRNNRAGPRTRTYSQVGGAESTWKWIIADTVYPTRTAC
jgi:alpha,alpha-trehalase